MDSELQPLPELGERIPLVHGLTLRMMHAADFPPDRDPELIELLRRAFNGGPAWFDLGVEPIDHLRWKLRDFPGIAILEVTEDGDTLVGMRVHHHHRFEMRGETVFASEEVDVALEPTYQGRGINSAQLTIAKHLVPLTPWYAYKLSLGAHPLHDRRRGKPTDDVLFGNPLLTLVKLISPLRLVRSRIAAWRSRGGDDGDAGSGTRSVMEARGIGNRASRASQAAAALGLARAALVSAIPRRAAAPTWTLRTIDHFEEQADRFWDRARHQFDLIQARDRAYLNWRFCDPRAGRYTVRAAEEGGELLGYVVLRIDPPGAVIVDLLTLPGRLDVLRSLIDDAVEVAREAGAVHLRCWSFEGHAHLGSLRRAGFATYPNIMFFTYRPGMRSMEELSFLSDPATRVHYQPSDTDHA